MTTETPPKEVLLKMYRELLTARRAEAELHARGTFAGHRGVGEEVIPIAICNNLTETDCFHPSFRTQYCVFAKPGFNLAAWINPGPKSGGKNMWLAPEAGLLATSGTLGEASLKLVGAAVAAQMLHTGDITVFAQGDGASNRAPTHEAMAIAGAWQLPIVFVIHNNKYGMGTSVNKSYNIKDLSVRGLGYGFPSDWVDGNDMIAMYQMAKKHIDRCRAGGGPSLIAADTWRVMPHFGGDLDTYDSYRPEGEAKEWMKKDPLPRYQKQLIDMGVLTGDDVVKMELEVAAEIKETLE